MISKLLTFDCLAERREGGNILLGSIVSTPETELLSPIPALASFADIIPRRWLALIIPLDGTNGGTRGLGAFDF